MESCLSVAVPIFRPVMSQLLIPALRSRSVRISDLIPTPKFLLDDRLSHGSPQWLSEARKVVLSYDSATLDPEY